MPFAHKIRALKGPAKLITAATRPGGSVTRPNELDTICGVEIRSCFNSPIYDCFLNLRSAAVRVAEPHAHDSGLVLHTSLETPSPDETTGCFCATTVMMP